MVIDFHTHTYPDKIAKSTIDFLVQKGGIKNHREGTLASLVESMHRSGVDYSVSLPVVTKPSQTATVNRISAELNGKDGVFFSGGIHPDTENIEETLDFIKNAGLHGIKIHPDYQGVYFDDERYIRILIGCAERGLYVTTHAGMDIGFPEDTHCTVDMIVRVLDELGPIMDDKLILAHMGSFDKPLEVLEKIAGRKVYLDTAVMLDRFPEECTALIKKHGSDRVLFATDSPWADQAHYVEVLRSLDLTDEEKENILHKNAERILGI
ncbi:MAG: amidohydrolase family protein [Clostridia bacterium]|nr:amidohydrolase family protein [Clostridia bacterium]